MSWKQHKQLGRTSFRKVRANSPAHRRSAERRCTCGEAVRLPEGEARAAKRSQEAARGVSGLVSGSEQVGMGAGVGKRQNKFTVGCVEVKKYPIVFNMAVAKTFKVAGECMILVLRRQSLALCKLKHYGIEFVFILAAPKHFLQVFAKSLRLENSVFHESRNSLSLAGSSQNCASGESTSCFASLYAFNIRWCLLLRVRAKGIPPTSRTLARKQLNAVDMFMPMSSKMSSTSALSSASVRNVMVVVIVCTPVVNTFASIVAYCTDRSNTILKAA